MNILKLLIVGALCVSCAASEKEVERRNIGFDPNDIRKVMRDNRKVFKACYENVVKDNPNVEGKVVVLFKIINGGKVRASSGIIKETTVNNSKLENCLISEIEKLSMPDPGPKQVAEVDYPFVFRKSKE